MTKKIERNRKTTKIDYTLEQFLAEAKQRETTIRTLEKISNVLDRLDKRVSKLESKK